MQVDRLPLISIVVPVYNVKKYLERCVESIINQTYRNLEIILVDDGSTDESSDMCEKWAQKDARIVVIHKENGGLSDARNVGMRVAHGDYVGFVDSDDWILPDMYMNLYFAIKKDDFDIAVCGIKRLYSTETCDFEDKGISYTVYSRDDYLKKILKVGTQDANHYACNKLYAKDIIKKMSYPKGLTCEDIEGTFLAVVHSKRIIEISVVGYIYMINPESITTGKLDERVFDYIRICDDLIEIAERNCTKEIISYAKAFRERADFSVLSKIAINDFKENFQCENEIRELILNIRKNYGSLMKSSIPLNRKILITCMCVSYPFTRRILYSFADLIRRNVQYK